LARIIYGEKGEMIRHPYYTRCSFCASFLLCSLGNLTFSPWRNPIFSISLDVIFMLQRFIPQMSLESNIHVHCYALNIVAGCT